MINMRKGYTLVEVLTVVIALPVLMLVLNGLFRTLIKDIPRSHQLLEENAVLTIILDRLQQDIDNAKGLPDSSGGYNAGSELVLIELADSVICYQLKDGNVLRRKLTLNQQSKSEEDIIWKTPHTNITWQVLKKDQNGYAIEVQTSIEYKIRGKHLEKKMANSHLYFVGAL
jgi:prepilin-type N-terminal cleavage/methylation domain-containing protein